MKIKDLNLPKSIIEFLQTQGYVELYPPQAASVDAGILDGTSVLVSAPTASGKTLIAMLAIISHLLKNNNKVIYLSPLRALAAEKFIDLKKLEKILPEKRVAISTGDYDNVDKKLNDADILILTNEKMDSVIRHGPSWIDDIGLVISDEIHLLGDPYRGHVLEMVLTRLKQLDDIPQIVGLSATITNADDISKWLDCKLVKDDWRPVSLTEGVYDGGTVTMNNGKSFDVDSTLRGAAVDLGVQCVKDGGQSLLFASTRPNSVSLAAKASEIISKFLDASEKKHLDDTSRQILVKNENTPLVKNLAKLVQNGVAFHHAGLNQNCRQVVEQEFRDRKIKLLASTPTLAAGVNLPARRVVVSSVMRYDGSAGVNKPISVLEYKQLCGRAGRPQYDDYGEAIIVGHSNTDDLMDFYVNGTPEPLESKITDEKALRIHVLSYISTNPGMTKDDVLNFFAKTFAGVTLGKSSIKFGISIALQFLKSHEFITKGKTGRYAATEFGKKISELYIDPMTASHFLESIENTTKKKSHTLGFLYLITSADEFVPKTSLRQGDYEIVSKLIEDHKSELITEISEYDCSRNFLALYHWITESSELSLSDNLKVELGDVHKMIDSSNWLIYCISEIAKQQKRVDLLVELDSLKTRITYGIRKELLDLVRIKGVGRVRARKLYNNDIKSLDDLASIPKEKLAKIDKIGSALANSIKSQIRRS